jgi:hypothetical protein
MIAFLWAFCELPSIKTALLSAKLKEDSQLGYAQKSSKNIFINLVGIVALNE